MADRFNFANFAVASLLEAVLPETTEFEINSDDSVEFPATAEGAKFPIVLHDTSGANSPEICWVTGMTAGGIMTVERGKEGTIAQSWLAGTIILHTFTAETLATQTGLTLRGPWSAVTTYVPRDVVVHLGISYIAVNQSLNITPTGVSADWQVIYSPPGAAGTALNWQGRWSNSITYTAGNLVDHNGRLWVAISGSLAQIPDPAITTYWLDIAKWSGAAFQEDVHAANGTNNYTVTIAGDNAPTALYEGLTFQVTFQNANTGGATLALPGLAAIPVRAVRGVTMPNFWIQPNEVYRATYLSAGAEFVLRSVPGFTFKITEIDGRLAGHDASIASLGGGSVSGTLVPVGAVLDWTGTAAPSKWLLCFGQAISRSTYSALFAVCGTAYGVGNGSTTFNVPDLRGRVAAGKDDMGGSNAARLSGTVSGTILGAAGGAATHALSTAELAAHSHPVTVTINAVGDHQHLYVQPQAAVQTQEFTTGPDPFLQNTQVQPTGGGGNHTHTNSASSSNTGSGNAHTNTQPTMIFNKIIFTGVT